MATKTIITGYESVEHILPADVLNLVALEAAGGEVVEEFDVEVQRATLETDSLVKVSVPADKFAGLFGGHRVAYVAGRWEHSPVRKEEHEITEEVIVEDVEPGEPEPTPDPDPLAQLQANLRNREKIAAENITRLKARAAAGMLAGGMSESATMAAGSQLVLDHAAKIQAYILAGGNPVAGQALIDEIVATPPAWWSAQMLALFEAELL